MPEMWTTTLQERLRLLLRLWIRETMTTPLQVLEELEAWVKAKMEYHDEHRGTANDNDDIAMWQWHNGRYHQLQDTLYIIQSLKQRIQEEKRKRRPRKTYGKDIQKGA